MIKWMIKHGFVSAKNITDEWADWATKRQLEYLVSRVAVIWGWIGGDRMEKFEKLAEETHKILKHDLDRWMDVERTRESNLGLKDIRTELRLLIDHLGLRETLREKLEEEQFGGKKES